MARTVFWSWQSDQPARETRTVIKTALMGALAALGAGFHEAERPEIDHDTKDVPGSPDIVAAILAKIEAAAVFVADVTPIAISESGKHVANPNVLIELGYAKRALSLSRVIQVWNTALTNPGPEDLPFDMRQKRAPIAFHLPIGTPTEELRKVRAALQKELEAHLRLALSAAPAEPIAELPWKKVDLERKFLWQGGGVPVLFDEETVDLEFEGPPAAYARLLPERWEMVPDAYDRLRRSNRQLSPLGRVGGLNWGPTTNGFLVTRWSDRIEQEGITPTATRWFRDTGEIWGVASSFFSESDGGIFFSSGYAGEHWTSWLNWHSDVCRTLGGTGPLHLRIGLVGLSETRWPTGPYGHGRGPRALEDSVSLEFTIDGPLDQTTSQVADQVDKMIHMAAAAYGVL